MVQPKNRSFPAACLAIAFMLGNTHPVASFSYRANASVLTTDKRKSATSLRVYQSPNSSPLEDEPWKRDASYWDMLQRASKDPDAFEKFIEESMAKKKIAASRGAGDENGRSPDKKRGKYQPIEEWDAQRKESMSAEERLQWECQRNGNRFRQNEILNHHLKSF
ncbi:hypothetical protein ACHAW6_006968 [Cyclotella cf. meneghiniana]